MSKSVSSLSLHWKGIVFTCSFQTRVPLFPASDPPGSRTSCSQGGPAKDRVGASLVAQRVKNLPAVQEIQVQSLGWKIPWRREGLPTTIFLPGEFHGQGGLAGYSPWGCKELDMTE